MWREPLCRRVTVKVSPPTPPRAPPPALSTALTGSLRHEHWKKKDHPPKKHTHLRGHRDAVKWLAAAVAFTVSERKHTLVALFHFALCLARHRRSPCRWHTHTHTQTHFPHTYTQTHARARVHTRTRRRHCFYFRYSPWLPSQSPGIDTLYRRLQWINVISVHI